MSAIVQTLSVLHDATEEGSPHIAALREQLVVDFEHVRHSAWRRVPKWLADNERWIRDPHEDEDGEVAAEVSITCRNLEQHLEAGPREPATLTAIVIASVMREHPTLNAMRSTTGALTVTAVDKERGTVTMGRPDIVYMNPNSYRDYRRLFDETKPKRQTLRASLMAALDRNAR